MGFWVAVFGIYGGGPVVSAAKGGGVTCATYVHRIGTETVKVHRPGTETVRVNPEC